MFIASGTRWVSEALSQTLQESIATPIRDDHRAVSRSEMWFIAGASLSAKLRKASPIQTDRDRGLLPACPLIVAVLYPEAQHSQDCTALRNPAVPLLGKEQLSL